MVKDLTKTLDLREVARGIGMLWKPLTDEQRELFIGHLLVKSFDRGDTLFDIGSTPTHLMYLMRGKVTFYSDLDNTPPHIVRMVGPKTLFGYQTAFNNKDYTYQAVSGDDTVVAMVPLSIVFNLIWENSQFAMVFIKDLATLLGISTQRTMHLTKKHIRGRLADSLLRMKQKYGTERDGQTIAVYLSREDLAGMSNMNTSNAIRTLSSFAAEGLIALDGRRIRILNEAALKRLSEIG